VLITNQIPAFNLRQKPNLHVKPSSPFWRNTPTTTTCKRLFYQRTVLLTLMRNMISRRTPPLIPNAVWNPSHLSRPHCLPPPFLFLRLSFARAGHFWPLSYSLPSSFRISAILTALGPNYQDFPLEKLAAANVRLVKHSTGVFGLEKAPFQQILRQLRLIKGAPLLEPRARTPSSRHQPVGQRLRTPFLCRVLQIYLKHWDLVLNPCGDLRLFQKKCFLGLHAINP